MRKYRFRIIVVAASVLLSIWFLLPTYQDYELSSQKKALTGADSIQFVEQHEKEIREFRKKRIKLGLDLQGGMRVVLEVNVVSLIEKLAKNKDDAFAAIIKEVRQQVARSDESPVVLFRSECERRGVRLSRYYLNLRDTDDDVFRFLEDEAKKAVDRGMQIVRNRVDQYGVSEPSIQKLGGTRIIVELPGVSNEREVQDLVGKTALLEFRLLKEPEVAARVMEGIDKYLAAKDSTNTPKDTSDITPEVEKTPEQFAKEHPFFAIAGFTQQGVASVVEENKDKVRRLLDRPDIQRLIPSDMEFLWSAKGQLGQDGKKYFTLYPAKKTAELEGGVITNARATIDPNYNQPIVTMEMNTEGSREWSRITGANINKRIAIVLDQSVFSAPVVRSKITGGHSQIEGMENLEEGKLLEIVLKAGALPAPVDIIEQRSVGPSLGEDSIRKGLLSAGLATLLTILFMVIYYHTGGVVADFAVVFCMLFILGVLAYFGGTLTLPGIAGIILTLAIAVDANVLIYERIREEQETGKTLRAAIDEGYSKAFSAILDSNVTTFITGLILFQFGSGPVQGFALTLIIGVAASMFSAIYITRIFFDIMTDKKQSLVNFG